MSRSECFCPPICRAPTPHIMVFGCGAFKRNLGLNEATRVGPSDRIRALRGGDTRELSSSSSLRHVKIQRKGTAHKPAEGPHQELERPFL